MIRPGVHARSHAGEPPAGGESCVKTMRSRSSSVRSRRLFKASSACSRHASVQVGSRDRRSRVLGQCFVLISPVGTRVLWRALAGGSSKQVSLRSLARHWGGSGGSRRLLPLRAVRAAPAAVVPASCVVLDRRCCQSRARCSVRQSAHRPAPRMRSAFHGGSLHLADALGQAALPGERTPPP